METGVIRSMTVRGSDGCFHRRPGHLLFALVLAGAIANLCGCRDTSQKTSVRQPSDVSGQTGWGEFISREGNQVRIYYPGGVPGTTLPGVITSPVGPHVVCSLSRFKPHDRVSVTVRNGMIVSMEVMPLLNNTLLQTAPTTAEK